MSSLAPSSFPQYSLSGMLPRSGHFATLHDTVPAPDAMPSRQDPAPVPTTVGERGGGGGWHLASDFFVGRRPSRSRTEFTSRHIHGAGYTASGAFPGGPSRGDMYSRIVAAGHGLDADMIGADDVDDDDDDEDGGDAEQEGAPAGATGGGGGDTPGNPQATGPPPLGVTGQGPTTAPPGPPPVTDPSNPPHRQRRMGPDSQQHREQLRQQQAIDTGPDVLAGRFAAMGMGSFDPYGQPPVQMETGDPYHHPLQAPPPGRSQRPFSAGYPPLNQPGTQWAHTSGYQRPEERDVGQRLSNVFPGRYAQAQHHGPQLRHRDPRLAPDWGMGHNMYREPYEPMEDYFQWVDNNQSGLPGQYAGRPPTPHDHYAPNYEPQSYMHDPRAFGYGRTRRSSVAAFGRNEMFRGISRGIDPYSEMPGSVNEGDGHRSQFWRFNDRGYRGGHPGEYVGSRRTTLGPTGDGYSADFEDSYPHRERGGPFGRSYEVERGYPDYGRTSAGQVRNDTRFNPAGVQFPVYGYGNQAYDRYQAYDGGLLREYAMFGAGRQGGHEWGTGESGGGDVESNRFEYYRMHGPYERPDNRTANEIYSFRRGRSPYGEGQNPLQPNNEMFPQRRQFQGEIPRPRSYPDFTGPNPLTRRSRHAMYPGLDPQVAPEIIRLLRRYERYSGRGRSRSYPKPEEAELMGFLAGKLLSSAGVTPESNNGIYAEYLEIYMKGLTKFGNGDEQLAQFRDAEPARRPGGGTGVENPRRLRPRQGYADDSETSTSSEK